MDRKTVERIFEKNYQTALKLEYIRKPYAWALYQTWEEVDKKEKKRELVKRREGENDTQRSN